MTAAEALKKAHEALERGDRAEARRSARQAAKLAPGHEAPWLYLAAAAEPRAGLAYLAKALEINPKSKAARKAIRWMVRRLPPAERRVAVAQAGLPERVRFVPLEALMPRRLFSARTALMAGLLMLGFGFWLGRVPADAREPQFASAPIAKASLTPTPTNTPTSTPTPTLTPTPTPSLTPTPSATPTARAAWSRQAEGARTCMPTAIPARPGCSPGS